MGKGRWRNGPVPQIFTTAKNENSGTRHGKTWAAYQQPHKAPAVGLPFAQRAQAIKRRRQIWEALHPGGVSSQIETKPNVGGRPVEFATDTASISGESRSGIYRHLARADAIGDEGLTKIAGTSNAMQRPLNAWRRVGALNRGEHPAPPIRCSRGLFM